MKRKLNFLGLGLELGQEQPGLRLSHEYIRSYFPVLKQLGLQIIDRGEISTNDPSKRLHENEHFRNINWHTYKMAYAKIFSLLGKKETVLNWGGDHSVALSTVGSFCRKYPDGHVLWIDAHADLNLPEHSPTGNLHGMPMSVLLNLQNVGTQFFPWIKTHLAPQNLIYLGTRDLDPFETETIHSLNIQNYSSEDVRQHGMTSIAHEIFKTVQNKPLHISEVAP